MMIKLLKSIAVIILVLGVLAGGAYQWMSRPSNRWNATNLSEIPAPSGYHRISVDKGSYAEYLRTLPLKPQGSVLHTFDGDKARNRHQLLSAGVIDQDMLSTNEQCADVTMRLRAEYLFQHGRYSEISFKTTGGETLQYHGGSSREAFKKFMCKVYNTCNTTSLFEETKSRDFMDVHIGDVFDFPASAHPGASYGHAILVVDVAVNDKGEKAVMCVEGLTPGCEKHLVLNPLSFDSAWFFIDPDTHTMHISVFPFSQDQLRYYPHTI